MSDLTEQTGVSPEFSEKYCQGKAWPLPRRIPHRPVQDKYEVVIAGAGPAGMFLRLLLARYGLGDESVLCVDKKSHPTDAGHADGVGARLTEVLATLSLEHDVVRRGRTVANEVEYTRTDGGLKRKVERPFVFCPARFGNFVGIHQGRIERLLLQDLQNYSKTCVNYSSAVTAVAIDEENTDYPVAVTITSGNDTRKVQAKYVIGADGAHSIVRRSVGIEMEGEAQNEIWGVVDFVPESNFKDVRKFVRLTKENGQMSSMVIPRERMSDGNWLSRIYVEMSAEKVENDMMVGSAVREEVRRKRAEIKRDHIFSRIQELFAPYYINPKTGTEPIWWTTYSVGQRLADRYIVEDTTGHPRIFLMGDACHTHSPRQAQGMNISMQDAYYLSWRLAYTLLGLAKDAPSLLKSYEEERRAWGGRVVFSDKRWNQSGYSWDDMLSEMRGQITGCGVEEAPGLLTSERNDGVERKGKDLLEGTLRTGRRLFNVEMRRFADGRVMDIHDDFPSDGRYRVLMLASTDYPRGRSATAMNKLCGLIKHFENGLIELVLAYPNEDDTEIEWDDMPMELKQSSEMSLYYADEKAYQTYGVQPEQGVIALIRPDGIVCITVALEGVHLIEELLQRVLVASKQLNGTAP